MIIEIIDEYQTPDGRYEYRVKVNDELLPPLSFPVKKTESELENIVNNMDINLIVEGEQ